MLARYVVDGLDGGLVALVEATIPLGQVATSALLSYAPDRIPVDAVDTVIAFSFGNRVAPDGTTTAGPMNEDLAATIERFVARRPVPVFAQHEIAHLLAHNGVERVTSIDPAVGPDGGLIYLSTAGVAEAIVHRAVLAGTELGVVGVIGFADHVVRCVLTARAVGLTAGVPDGVMLPSTYDPESGQPWTRDRRSYLSADLLGRVATR